MVYLGQFTHLPAMAHRSRIYGYAFWFLSGLIPFPGFGQPVSVSGSAAQPGPATTATLRAVVVGVSDYRDPNIRKLQFAHRDAQAFADYLRSDAAGRMPKDIRVLTNQEATLAAVDDALNWLKTSSSEGDVAIVYLACHGDLEKEALWQFGYLLTYDSPPNNFRNNAIRVEDLDLLAIELSSVRKVRTLFFLDACHSGTLSEGRNVPTEHLANQKANEVRILSCKADQLSMEGPDWGGGRGVFSYYLIRGLQGLANESANTEDSGFVTIEELTDYFRKTVVKDTKTIDPAQRQDPVIVAEDATFPLSQVVPDILAVAESEPTSASSGEVAGRQSRDLDGATTPEATGIVQSHFWSEMTDLLTGSGLVQAVHAEDLGGLSPDRLRTTIMERLVTAIRNGDLTDWNRSRFLRLVGEAQMEMEKAGGPEAFNLKLALALHDRCQAFLNDYLSANPEELEERSYTNWETSRYRWFPGIFRIAGLLLPEDHPLKAKLAVKEAYFNGVCLRLQSVTLEDKTEILTKALDWELKALALDDKAPYIRNELGILYRRLGDPQESEAQFRQALDLSPSWGLPWSNLGALYTDLKRYDEARNAVDRALDLLPAYATAHLNEGRIDLAENRLLEAESAFLEAVRLDKQNFAGYEYLGQTWLRTAEFQRADQAFARAYDLRHGLFLTMADADQDGIPDSVMSDDLPLPPPAPDLLPEVLAHPRDPELRFRYGLQLTREHRYPEAARQLQEALRLKPDYTGVWDHLAWAFWQAGDLAGAERAIRQSLDSDGPAEGKQVLLARVLEASGRVDEAIQTWFGLVNQPAYHLVAVRALGQLLEDHGRPDQAERWYASLSGEEGRTGELDGYYHRMIDREPDQPDWMIKLAGLKISFCLAHQPEEEDFVVFMDEPPSLHLSDGLVTGFYRTAPVASPHRDPEVYHVWPGCCREPLGLLDRAYPFLRSVTERASVQRDRGEILAWMQDGRAAEEAFALSQSLDPTREDVRDRMAGLFRTWNRLSEARRIRNLQDSLGHLRYPDYLELIRWDLLAGDYAGADTLLARVDHFLPGPETADTAALWQARGRMMAGRTDQAIREFTAIADKGPGSVDPWYALAVLNTQEGNISQAYQALKNAFRDHPPLVFALLRDSRLTPLRDDSEWAGFADRYEIRVK